MPARQAEGPHGMRIPQVTPDLLVDVHPLVDQTQLVLAHVVQAPTEIHPAQQTVDNRQGIDLIAPLPLRIRPRPALLRQHGSRQRRGDGGVQARVLLVARRLDGMHRQHSVVHALGAARAALDDQAGIPVEEAAHPTEIRPLVLELRHAGRTAADVRPLHDLDVIVELEEARAQVDHEVMHDLVHPRARLRVSVVELVPPLLDHPLALLLEEGFLRQALGHHAAHADHLRLYPQARDESPAPDLVEQGLEAGGEALLRGLPEAHIIPPVAVVGVPAGVDDEVLRP